MEKKITALTVGLLVIGLAVTACANSSKKQEAESAIEPVTFTFYSADGWEDNWSDPVADYITEQTGVTLKSQYPSNTKDNGIDLMIATGEYADFIFAKGDASTLLANDAFLDLSDLIDEYGPHIKKLYGDEYENLRSKDGGIYQLCSDCVQDEITNTGGTVQLQWAVLEQNDYQYPQTLAEYSAMIEDYMARHSKIDGKDTIGISLCVTDWRWYTMLSNPSSYIVNGSVDNGQWMISEDGICLYKHTVEDQKLFYSWLNEMYHKGILDPEFATQSYDDYLDKVASGRVLGLLDAEWSYGEAETTLLSEDKEERTYCGLPVVIDESVKCATLRQVNLAVGWGIGISKTCKDPVRAVQFLDFLCREETQVLTHWGIEGVNYYYEDGKRVRSQAEIERSLSDVNYGYDTGVGLHTYPFPSYGSKAVDSTGNYICIDNKETVKESYTEHELEAVEAWGVEYLTDIFPQADSFPELSYSPLWSMELPIELDTLVAQLDEASRKGLINCIICSPEDFDSYWNRLQKDLEVIGVERANEMMTEIVKENIANRREHRAD